MCIFILVCICHIADATKIFIILKAARIYFILQQGTFQINYEGDTILKFIQIHHFELFFHLSSIILIMFTLAANIILLFFNI